MRSPGRPKMLSISVGASPVRGDAVVLIGFAGWRLQRADA